MRLYKAKQLPPNNKPGQTSGSLLPQALVLGAPWTHHSNHTASAALSRPKELMNHFVLKLNPFSRILDFYHGMSNPGPPKHLPKFLLTVGGGEWFTEQEGNCHPKTRRPREMGISDLWTPFPERRILHVLMGTSWTNTDPGLETHVHSVFVQQIKFL